MSGHLEIVHGDDFEDHHHAFDSVPGHILPDLDYWLETDDGGTLLLEFEGHPPAASSGSYYTVRGQRHGRSFHVADMAETADEKGGGGGGGAGGKPGGGGGGGGRPKQPPVSYVGARDMVVIAMNFVGHPEGTLPFTDAEIRERGFGTVGRTVTTYYTETSATTDPVNPVALRGKNDGTPSDPDGLPGDVAFVNLQASSLKTAECDYFGWAEAGKTAAAAAGWDLTGYEHIVYLHPKLSAGEAPLCDYGGRGSLGAPSSWLNGNIKLGTWVHELGHNFTLHHATGLACQSDDVLLSLTATPSTDCYVGEYSDPFDVMGRTPEGGEHHFNGRNKARLTWFAPPRVATVTSGEFTLYPIEERTTLGYQVLQVPRGNDFLYVDFRKTSGQFDAYGPTHDAVEGVMLRLGDGLSTISRTYLIDTESSPSGGREPSSGLLVPDYDDAALGIGEGFVDPVGRIYVEALRINSDGSITVKVVSGYSDAAPVVEVAGNHGPILTRVPHTHLGGTATDVDKNLAFYRWEFASCPGTCPQLLFPAGSMTGDDESFEGVTFTPEQPGTYTLVLTVWDLAGRTTSVTVTEEAIGV